MASRVLQKGKNRITQGYKNISHKGIDLGREHIMGEPIIAHSTGTIVSCVSGQKNNKGATGTASYGNYVKIDHGDGYETLYAHLAKVNVKNGNKVKQGQVIGTMGNTGRSFGMHLHFEVRKDNVRIDPTQYLESDLPLANIDVNYKVFTNQWLHAVTNCNDVNSNGYAGINNKAMTALMAKPTRGSLKYRVHLLKEKRWLPWVTDNTDYAGNYGEQIDAVQMQLIGADGYEVQYRVSPTNSKKWYGWCTGLKDSTGDGYAGVFGVPVDCIQCKIVKVVK